MPFTPRFHEYAVLPSTMDEARRMAVADLAPEGTVVQAGAQTAGRGRFGNAWRSPQGNLYMTLLLRPKAFTRICAQVSFVIAVALADTLKNFGVPRASIGLKWPNDVLVDGAKIAGILLEMESGQGETPVFLLAGIGVNIRDAPESCAYLHQFNKDIDAQMVRDDLVKNIAALYEHWLENGFGSTRARWLEQAYGIGQPVTARMSHQTIDGVLEGVDGDGNLSLLRDNGEILLINSGAVHFKVP
jgi:BirA family transcriptional regulator, biotin operon repressor / biotin---[acetyl-CoA-carboxylase] ligase